MEWKWENRESLQRMEWENDWIGILELITDDSKLLNIKEKEGKGNENRKREQLILMRLPLWFYFVLALFSGHDLVFRILRYEVYSVIALLRFRSFLSLKHFNQEKEERFIGSWEMLGIIFALTLESYSNESFSLFVFSSRSSIRVSINNCCKKMMHLICILSKDEGWNSEMSRKGEEWFYFVLESCHHISISFPVHLDRFHSNK